ncbi:hypothetical protein GC176_23895 [bacterium]|nr:hypothetical protein [bacterium]
MSIRNRRVLLTAVTEFLRLAAFFRQVFLKEFTRRLNDSTTSMTVGEAEVHDAFISACQQSIDQLRAAADTDSSTDSNRKLHRVA